MVIFRPMRHVGWRSASSGPTFFSSAAEWLRNGPPDAVRMSRLISAWSRPCRHWWMALCSLSTGQDRHAVAAAAAVTMAPAMTSTSLLASAIVLPASIAASTASRAAVPDEAQSRMSTSGCVATATSPSAPDISVGAAAPPRCPRTVSRACGGGHGRHVRAHVRHLARKQARVRAGGQADDLQAVRMGLDDGQGAAANRAGRSEDGDSPAPRRGALRHGTSLRMR